MGTMSRIAVATVVFGGLGLASVVPGIREQKAREEQAAREVEEQRALAAEIESAAINSRINAEIALSEQRERRLAEIRREMNMEDAVQHGVERGLENDRLMRGRPR